MLRSYLQSVYAKETPGHLGSLVVAVVTETATLVVSEEGEEEKDVSAA